MSFGSAGADDLRGGTPRDWLVIGWFTPDYRPLALRFAANLALHDVPFHLFARPKLSEGWNTSQKPSVVLDAMDDYPGKALILMDVDCVVNGNVAPAAILDGDVGITVIAQNVPGRMDRRLRHGAERKWHHWIAVECSSRVVVFRPTAGARAFVEEWRERVETSTFNHDEHSMVWAYLRCPEVAFRYIDARYSGRELAQLPDAVIGHDSEHGKLKAERRGGISALLRALERRYLRTGRTQSRKRHLQAEAGAVILQKVGRVR
jgi:hypothetical protein